MEDLLWLLFLVVAMTVVAVLATLLAAIAGALAAICVFGAAAHAFSVTMSRGILHRGGVAAVSGPDEPAFVAYYRTQVWHDLGLAARTGWRRAVDETARIQATVPQRDHVLNEALRITLKVYGYIGLGLGAAAAAAVGALPALLIMLVSAGGWAIGAPTRWLERVRRERRGTHFDCAECHDRFPLPTYTCPNCGAKHKALAPSRHGVLHHRCTCGARLPALGLLGRERLASECPSKGHLLGEGVGSVRTLHVPVAGGPATGKSTFLAGALLELERAAADGTLATSVQSSSMDGYNRLLDGFRRGVLPAKTVDLQAPALVAEVRGKASSVLLYAYDVAGEAYGTEDELRRDPAYGLPDGVVLLVDPFALARVRDELRDEIAAATGLRASTEAPQRMLERLIGVLEEHGTNPARLPAAVCVTKTDALGIDTAIAAAPGADGGARTRAWLEAQGAGNFLRAAETTFHEIAYFGVSALGRSPGTGSGPFTQVGTLEPLLWLLSRAGVEPAAAGEAQATQTDRLAGSPLLVTPRRPVLSTPINALKPLGYAGNFAIGAVVFCLLALSFLPLSARGEPPAASNAEPPVPAAHPASGTAYTTSVYSLQVPDGWIRDRDERNYGTYVSSQWHLRGSPNVSFRVDYTPGFDGSAASGARSVRALFAGGRVRDYVEVDWRPSDIHGQSAWRWRFRLEDRDVEKIDWFFKECSAGVALLAAAPTDEFEEHLPTFEALVDSLRRTCG